MYSIPESGGSPGEGNNYPLQYSCLEISMDRAAWWATVHEVLMSIGLEARLLTLKSYPDINCITWTSNFVVAVQSLSHVHFFAIPWPAALQTSLSITNSWSLLNLMSIESVMPSNHLILMPPSPPALNLSQHQGLFKWVSSLHQVDKVLEFQLHQSFQWTPKTDLL